MTRAILAAMPPRRLSKAEIAQRRQAIFDIVAEMQPMTVRGAYYQAEVRSIVPKTDSGYDAVDADLCRLREWGELPYEWIVDNTRGVIKPWTFPGVREALEDAAHNYRKDLWHDADCRVQIWIEKDALSGVIEPVTMKYDVPLLPARGYSSMTFLYQEAKKVADLGIPIYVYHFGDYDPSGVNAGENIEKDLREHAPDAEIHFSRIAVTPEQIRRWNLPTRPTKMSDSRAARFGSPISCELDAIDPRRLRQLVEDCIKRHMTKARFDRLTREERREQELIMRLVGAIEDG